jgi:hypothetical protein
MSQTLIKSEITVSFETLRMPPSEFVPMSDAIERTPRVLQESYDNDLPISYSF